MSMHKIPLTLIEETGLIAHGFGSSIGKPSQGSDIFRNGVAWGMKTMYDRMESVKAQLDHGMPFDDDLRQRLTELLEEMKTKW